MSIKEHVKSMVKSVILLDKRRNRINMCNRAKLRNMEMSILSSNCAGGVMSHDLGLPFRSQFVNLALRPKDFVKYLRDLDYYNSLDVRRHFSGRCRAVLGRWPISSWQGWRCYHSLCPLHDAGRSS